MGSRRHMQMVNYIQQQVEQLDSYQSESMRRLYHVGFLTGFLAKILLRDPFLLQEFNDQIDQHKKENTRKRG